MTKFKILFAATLALSNAWITPVFANPIDNFHEVRTELYRGARPGPEGVRYLNSIGVKTIINLDDDMDDVVAENRLAKRLGMNMIAHPMSGFWTPKDETVNAVLDILRDNKNYPVFVHCKYGRDRTGLIIGLYRVEQEGWSPEEAYDEMLELGFRRRLIFLKNYFSQRSGLDD